MHVHSAVKRQSAAKRVDHQNEAFADIAGKALTVFRRIPVQKGNSGGGYYVPYKGAIDIEGFRITVEGNKQVQFGSNDFGTFTVQLLSVKQNGKTRSETTEEVLKFEYYMKNGHQHMVFDRKPMKLMPQTDERGKIKGEFSPGRWQRKFIDLVDKPTWPVQEA